MVTIKNIPIVLVALTSLLASCAPQKIPRDADRNWSLKGSFSWEWSRDVEHGCVAWFAKETYAVLNVIVDAKCEGPRDQAFYQDNSGVNYFSSLDQLLFQGYSSWKPNPSKDENGKFLDWPERCPYSISQSQIDTLRVVLAEVLDLALTDSERRTLQRVDKRLSETQGSSLRVSSRGCVDVINDRAREQSAQIFDPWDEISSND